MPLSPYGIESSGDPRAWLRDRNSRIWRRMWLLLVLPGLVGLLFGLAFGAKWAVGGFGFGYVTALLLVAPFVAVYTASGYGGLAARRRWDEFQAERGGLRDLPEVPRDDFNA